MMQLALNPSRYPEWHEKLNNLTNTHAECMMPLWDYMNVMDMSEMKRLQMGCMEGPFENGRMSEDLQRKYMTEELQR